MCVCVYIYIVYSMHTTIYMCVLIVGRVESLHMYVCIYLCMYACMYIYSTSYAYYYRCVLIVGVGAGGGACGQSGPVARACAGGS